MTESKLRAPVERNLVRRWSRWLFPSILWVLFVAQCSWFVRTQSLTYDEPVDIAGGLDAWRHNRFELYNDHTPLARLLCTLPLWNDRWQIDLQTSSTVGWRVSRILPDPESMAHRARAMNVMLGLILAVLLWTSARRIFSESAANLALALYVFSPTVVANFSVATTDGSVALLIFASVVQLIRWKEKPSWGRTGLLGMVLGLMLLAKFSAPVMFVLAMGWVLVLHRDGIWTGPRRWNWTKAIAVVAIASAVVWAGYFFHVSRVTLRNGELTTSFPNREDVVYKPIHNRMNFSVLVPAGEYLEGFRTVVRHNRHGMPGYFLGQVSKTGGWRSYYPTVMLLKWPITTLLLCVAGLVLLARGKIHAPRGIWVVASFPVVYLGFAVFSHYNMGDRHILPVYIFVLLFAGGVWEAVRSRRAWIVIVVAVVCLQAADEMRYAPDYLSYFNFFVGNGEAYRYLDDSGLDWGQGLLALRAFEQGHAEKQISLAYFGSVEPQVYGIRARPLGENERATGIVVVSDTNLGGQFLENPEAYRWLLRYPRVGVLNHSLQVFEVPEKP